MLRKKIFGLLAMLALVPFMCLTAHAQNTGGGTGGGGNTGGGTIGGGNTGGGNTGGGTIGGGTGGGGTGNGGLTTPADQLAAPEFEDIRREVRFAGQSLDTIVHPYSQNFSALQTDINSIAGGASGANAAGGARTTTTQAGTNVQSPFGGFNDPFQALFFSQFQSQNAIIRSRLTFEESEFLPPPPGSLTARDSQMVSARRSQLLGNRLRTLPNLNNQSIQVNIVDGIATLTGTVESESRRQQMERLLNMEAGVRSVVNKLQVQ